MAETEHSMYDNESEAQRARNVLQATHTRTREFLDQLERADLLKHFPLTMLSHMETLIRQDVSILDDSRYYFTSYGVPSAQVHDMRRVIARAHAEGANLARFKVMETLYPGLH